MGLPKVNRWTRFLQSDYFVEGLIAWFALTGGIAKVWGVLDPKRTYVIAGLWATAAIGVFVCSIGKVYLKWCQQYDPNVKTALDGCLTMLETELVQELGTDKGIRTTIHRVEHEKLYYEQVTDYVGDSRGNGKAGRRYRLETGIVGKAIRSGDFEYSVRQNRNHTKFIDELRQDWNYTKKEAGNIDTSTMSCVAHPIHRMDESVTGVLYIDSTEPDSFDGENARQIIRKCCIGIANFVDRL